MIRPGDGEGSFSFGCKFWIKDVPFKASGLKPDLIIDSKQGEFGSDPVFHELLCKFVHSKCFFL